jgi:putative ABC transport system substrate-binding protein
MRLSTSVLMLFTLLANAPADAVAQSAKLPRVGWLSPGNSETQLAVYGAFVRGMHDLGYIDGRDFIAERRFWGNDDHAALTNATEDLVRSRVDVIVSSGTTAVRTLQAATRTIPIVMTAVGDPISSGLVAALARPGGNTTGLSILSKDLAAKRMELIKEARPESRRLAVIENPNNSLHVLTIEEIASTASSLGLVMRPFPFLQPEEYNRAFASMSQWPADLGIVLDEGIFVVNRALIAAAAIRERLPLACGFREMAEAGCLISYSPRLLDIQYRAASFVVKILKGANVAELPVEQPTTFELVVNLKTAKTLGLDLPGSLVARADKVIE